MLNNRRDESIKAFIFPENFIDPDGSGVFSGSHYLPGDNQESWASTSIQKREQLRILQHHSSFVPSHQETLPSSLKTPKGLFPLIVDYSCLELERREQEQFVMKLRVVFDSEPVEDGVSHPAEQIIDETLNSTNRLDAYRWLGELAVDVNHPGIAASVIRCLSRRESEPIAWRVKIAAAALKLDDVEIRDAAVQAVEAWGEPEFRKALELHSEDVAWLRNYIEDVIDNLGDLD